MSVLIFQRTSAMSETHPVNNKHPHALHAQCLTERNKPLVERGKVWMSDISLPRITLGRPSRKYWAIETRSTVNEPFASFDAKSMRRDAGYPIAATTDLVLETA